MSKCPKCEGKLYKRKMDDRKYYACNRDGFVRFVQTPPETYLEDKNEKINT